MADSAASSNVRPDPDPLLVAIARYVASQKIDSNEAFDTARHCLMDSLACALMALEFPACTKLLGPVVAGTDVPRGVPVPGTPHRLDPHKAAFDIGATVRWLDFNDTWLAAEWGHPSDNLGAILATADFVSRNRVAAGRPPLAVRDVLAAMIKAHEIQGVLALENSFNRVGLDHVVLVKVASTAVATWLLGGSESQIVDALSHAWVDGQSLRTYRHAPNTGSRKSWAAGDATSRAVKLAMMTLAGEPGLPSPLSAPKWGFCDVLFGGRPLTLPRPLGTYVMENVLFKISFPAEFHAQTAVECALELHPHVADRCDEIERVELYTQEPAVRIISKTGPLHNSADRDHCLQFMVAVPLLFGRLDADCYDDAFAADERIDALRAKMTVAESPDFTRAYYDPDRRAIPNAVQVFFRDGSCTEQVACWYPVGHRRRRAEGIPLLLRKFADAVANHYSPQQSQTICELCNNAPAWDALPIHHWMDMLATRAS